MNHTHSSSFGLYEAARILIPGFYFTSLCVLFASLFISPPFSFSFDSGYLFIAFPFLVLVSGLTMYAKETTKRRRAFQENQPSTFLQDLARRHAAGCALDDTEARQLYFYILNNLVSPAFHEKVFFFGTVYHIMIQIRRTTFAFVVLSILFCAVQIARGESISGQPGLIFFCALVCLIYILNVTYNKADRKMQENYQDQIFWLHMNEDAIKDLIQKYDRSRKGVPA